MSLRIDGFNSSALPAGPSLALIAAAVCCVALATTVHATQVDWKGPEGSRAFGSLVKVLPNGNIVVTDPEYSLDGEYPFGAVHLYRPNGERISTLTGRVLDYLGSGGVYLVGDSNFVVCSPRWRDIAIGTDVGAATWVDGDVGLEGEVSSSNSLTGSSSQSSVCQYGVTTLTNGHYVVPSPQWVDGALQGVGPVSWCDGNKGCRGLMSATVALTGSRPGDYVGHAFGNGSVFPFPNGDYAVISSSWSSAEMERIGAVTVCGGQGQCNGVRVSALNSIVGARPDDFVGGTASPDPRLRGITVLENGDFVIYSAHASSGQAARVGAVTRVSGSSMVGPISPDNSLYGSAEDDFLEATVAALESGNYVINAPNWDNGAVADAGASVLCKLPAGCAGVLSSGSGLTGTTAHDRVGYGAAVALANGNYVVTSPLLEPIGSFAGGCCNRVRRTCRLPRRNLRRQLTPRTC